MNQKFWSGLTTAALVLSTLAVAPSTQADQPSSVDEPAASDLSAESAVSEPVEQSATPLPNPSQEPTAAQADQVPTADAAPAQPQRLARASAEQPAEAVKVGEYQSQEAQPEATVAIVEPHDLEGRQAATLYVRNLPVLTFLGTTASSAASETPETSDNQVKVAQVQGEQPEVAESSETAAAPQDENDPLWRATSIAARLNQLHQEGIDAETITAAWDDEQQQYEIKVGEDELVAMSDDTILPDTTRDLAQDVLQATNRLRRQIGNAEPVQEITGAPAAFQRVVSSITSTLSGLASWYGPGFSGSYTASGERFNPSGLTAAHRSLPFGTQVRVTNMNTGQSVVVRINDRGPFSHNRVIDLSAGAAQVIGLVQAGVAPVNIDVMGTATSVSNTGR